MGSAVLNTMVEEHSPSHHSCSSATLSGADTHTAVTANSAPTAAVALDNDGLVHSNSTLTTYAHHSCITTHEDVRNPGHAPCPAPASPFSLVPTPGSIAATASAAIGSLAEACQALHSTASSFAAPLLLWGMPEPAAPLLLLWGMQGPVQVGKCEIYLICWAAGLECAVLCAHLQRYRFRQYASVSEEGSWL
eukprot:975408-Pelagomonas_calceolata.AAC.2